MITFENPVFASSDNENQDNEYLMRDVTEKEGVILDTKNEQIDDLHPRVDDRRTLYCCITLAVINGRLIALSLAKDASRYPLRIVVRI